MQSKLQEQVNASPRVPSPGLRGRRRLRQTRSQGVPQTLAKDAWWLQKSNPVFEDAGMTKPSIELTECAQ